MSSALTCILVLPAAHIPRRHIHTSAHGLKFCEQRAWCGIVKESKQFIFVLTVLLRNIFIPYIQHQTSPSQDKRENEAVLHAYSSALHSMLLSMQQEKKTPTHKKVFRVSWLVQFSSPTPLLLLAVGAPFFWQTGCQASLRTLR